MDLPDLASALELFISTGASIDDRRRIRPFGKTI
jgi:hypothetical protein